MSRIFISYRHENPEHKARVRLFAEQLQRDGIDVILDQFLPPGGPKEGWNLWSERMVSLVENPEDDPNAPEKILIIASKGWFSVYRGTDPNPESGIGSSCEIKAIHEIISASWKGSIDVPVRIVSFEVLARKSIPPGLRGLERYDVSNPQEYESLRAWIQASGYSTEPKALWPKQTLEFASQGVSENEKAWSDRFAPFLTDSVASPILCLQTSTAIAPSALGAFLTPLVQTLRERHDATIRYAMLDLKGGTSLGPELPRFLQELKVKVPETAGLEGSERDQLQQIYDQLRTIPCPTLLVFPNFDLGGEIREWLLQTVLPDVSRQPWLRLILTGTSFPPIPGQIGKSSVLAPTIFTPRLEPTAPVLEETIDEFWKRFEQAFAHLSCSDREELRRALQAAAIPHWCDPGFLAALVDTSLSSKAESLFEALRTLPDLEPFAARGRSAILVTPATRRLLRTNLLVHQPERLRIFSARAAEHLSTNDSRTGRIERIYHRLVAEGEDAAEDAEALDQEFWQGFGTADHSYYASTLLELVPENSVAGRARMEVLLSASFSANKQHRWNEAQRWCTQARTLAETTLEQTNESIPRALWLWGLARTYCVEGEFLAYQQNQDAALSAYREYRDLMEQATRLAPDLIRLRKEWVVAETRLGNVWESINPQTAQQHYRNARLGQEKVVRDKPDDPAEARSLAMMDCLEASAFLRLGKAQEALPLALRFKSECEKRIQRDAENTLWANDCATSYRLLGDTYQLAGQTAEALQSFRSGLEAALRWCDLERSEEAESSARIAQGRLLNILLPMGEFSEAQKLIRSHREACRLAAEASPSDLGLRFAWALAYRYSGDWSWHQGRYTEAIPEYERAEELFAPLVSAQPHPEWRREWSRVLGLRGQCLKALGKKTEAQRVFERQLELDRKLEDEGLGTYGGRISMVWTHLFLGSLASEDLKLSEAEHQYQAGLKLARSLAETSRNAESARTLAQALIGMGGIHLLRDRPLDALACAQEACRIDEELAEQAPTDLSRVNELAQAKLHFATFLEKWGDLEAANQRREEAETIFNQLYDHLAKEGCENYAALNACEQAAILAARQGRWERARNLYLQLLTESERIEQKQGASLALELSRKRPEWNGALGEVFTMLGQLSAAQNAYENARKGWEALQESQPHRVEWRHHVALMHARLADLAVSMRDFPTAEQEFAQAIQGLEQSWKKSSANPFWRQDLVIARYRRAAHRVNCGQAQDALDDLAACRIHLEVIDQLPDQGLNIKRQMIELENLTGDVEHGRGHWDNAILAYERASERADALLRIDPANALYRALKSLTVAKLAQACLSADRCGEADLFFQQRESYCEEQVARNENDLLHLGELAWAKGKRGEIAARQEEIKRALEFHRAAFEILEKLVAHRSDEVLWLHQWADQSNRLAILMYQSGYAHDAVRYGLQAIELGEKLRQLLPTVEIYRRNLEVYRRNVEGYRLALG